MDHTPARWCRVLGMAESASLLIFGSCKDQECIRCTSGRIAIALTRAGSPAIRKPPHDEQKPPTPQLILVRNAIPILVPADRRPLSEYLSKPDAYPRLRAAIQLFCRICCNQSERILVT